MTLVELADSVRSARMTMDEAAVVMARATARIEELEAVLRDLSSGAFVMLSNPFMASTHRYAQEVKRVADAVLRS